MGDFTGAFFSNRPLPAKALGAFARAAVPDSVLTGCALSYSGTALTIAAGTMIACGRVFSLAEAKTLALTGATSGYARVIVEIDLTASNTSDSFNQVALSVDYAASKTAFAALTQEDVNTGGTVYQMPLCYAALSSTGITGVESVARTDQSARGAVAIDLLWENESPTSSFAGQTISSDDWSVSDYDLIYVSFATKTSYPNVAVGALGVAVQGVSENLYYYNGETSSWRSFWGGGTANHRGVYFTDGKQGSATNNSVLIPRYIYGIKGVT